MFSTRSVFFSTSIWNILPKRRTSPPVISRIFRIWRQLYPPGQSGGIIANMAKFIFYVQPKGKEAPLPIDGDQATEADNFLIIYEAGQVVGRFSLSELQGWWKQKP